MTAMYLPNQNKSQVLHLSRSPGQIAVPEDRDDVHDQDSVMKRDELEVDQLDQRPAHVVRLQDPRIVLVELRLRILALKYSKRAKEAEKIGRRKEQLVAGYAGEDCAVLGREDDFVLQELEPGCCSGAEYACWGDRRQLTLFVAEIKNCEGLMGNWEKGA
jgi:hypothetical protein